MSTDPLSQVLACPLPTTAKPQGDRTHQPPDMDSLASHRRAQVLPLAHTLRCLTLRCPIHRDPTLRGLISKDQDNQAFLVTRWEHLQAVLVTMVMALHLTTTMRSSPTLVLRTRLSDKPSSERSSWF